MFLVRVVIEIIRPKDNFIQLDLAEKPCYFRRPGSFPYLTGYLPFASLNARIGILAYNTIISIAVHTRLERYKIGVFFSSKTLSNDFFLKLQSFSSRCTAGPPEITCGSFFHPVESRL